MQIGMAVIHLAVSVVVAYPYFLILSNAFFKSQSDLRKIKLTEWVPSAQFFFFFIFKESL